MYCHDQDFNFAKKQIQLLIIHLSLVHKVYVCSPKRRAFNTLYKCAVPLALSKTVSGHDLLLVELPVQSIPERQQVMN